MRLTVLTRFLALPLWHFMRLGLMIPVCFILAVRSELVPVF
jgi:hypothetical protein